MKRLPFLFALQLLLSIQTFAQPMEEDLQRTLLSCPFKMPAVPLPQFAERSFSIVDSGAVADGKTLNTIAFEKTIAACAAAGGGTVVVPAGTWLTGPIKMRSNINLHLEKDALIQFTTDRTQFPMIKAGGKSSTIQPASPIYGYDLKNIAITGEGIIDGGGQSWRQVKKDKQTPEQWSKLIASGGVVSADGKIWWPSEDAINGDKFISDFKASGKKANAENYLPARDFLRPHLLFLVDCQTILIEGVTIRNSPKFVFYPSRCTNLTMKHVKVLNEWWAQNGDGIDLSACKNAIIYKCFVSCGDDAICMKSSRGSTADSSFNLENIVITQSVVERGHGGFVIGSNTDGGMRNIFVTNCEFNGTEIGIRVKSNAGRGGTVKDIYIQDITMSNIEKEAILFDTYYADVPAGKTKEDDKTTTANDKIPDFNNFHITGVTCDGAKTAISIRGLPNAPIHHINFNNINITSKKGANFTNAANLNLTDVKIVPAEGEIYTLDNVAGIHINKGFCPPGTTRFLTASGTTSNINLEATPLTGKTKKLIKLNKPVKKKDLKVK